MTTIVISILNFNSAVRTVDCVQSLLAARKHLEDEDQIRVLVADNGSVETDIEILNRAFESEPKVELYRHGENLGFAGGHNRNLARVFRGQAPDYVWVLNNDCVVDGNALRALLDCARSDPTVGIWGATLVEKDGRTIQCAGGCRYNSWLTTYRPSGAGLPVERRGQLKPPKLDYIAGACLFFPATTLTSGLLPVGGAGRTDPERQWFNEAYFLYFEELDLARRLDKRLELAWCREALITHWGGASTGTGERQQPTSEFHATLSALIFSRSYHPNRLWFIAPARFTLKSIQLLVQRRITLVRELVSAYRAFFFSAQDEIF